METQKPKRLLADWAFQEELSQDVATAVCTAISRFLPCNVEGVDFILRSYGINFRFYVHPGGGGADINCSRVNVQTDGRDTVTKIWIG